MWSADQKADPDQQVARLTAWATDQQIPVDKVVTEVVSALNGHRGTVLVLLRDPSVDRIVVEHRDRFCRFDSEYVDDDLVGDMAEILTSMCGRLYGKRAAANRAKRVVAAAADGGKREAA